MPKIVCARGYEAAVIKLKYFYLPNNMYCILVTNRNPTAVAISKKVAISPIIASFILKYRLKIPSENNDPKMYFILKSNLPKKNDDDNLTK